MTKSSFLFPIPYLSRAKVIYYNILEKIKGSFTPIIKNEKNCIYITFFLSYFFARLL